MKIIEIHLILGKKRNSTTSKGETIKKKKKKEERTTSVFTMFINRFHVKLTQI